MPRKGKGSKYKKVLCCKKIGDGLIYCQNVAKWASAESFKSGCNRGYTRHLFCDAHKLPGYVPYAP